MAFSSDFEKTWDRNSSFQERGPTLQTQRITDWLKARLHLWALRFANQEKNNEAQGGSALAESVFGLQAIPAPSLLTAR
jgi:hypothetical protein